MRELKTWLALLSLSAGLVFLPGFGSQRPTLGNNDIENGILHYVALLKSGTPQQKAAAAYRLGQQRSSELEVVSALADLLGDRTAIDVSRYRPAIKDQKPTLGEEVAAALVQIGRPSIPHLIHVLKTSPSAAARKNAAWALGALYENTASA